LESPKDGGGLQPPKTKQTQRKSPDLQKKKTKQTKTKRTKTSRVHRRDNLQMIWKGWCEWLNTIVAPPPTVVYMLKAKTWMKRERGWWVFIGEEVK